MELSPSPSPAQLATEPARQLAYLIRLAVRLQRPFAVWRLPNQTAVHLIIDFYGDLAPREPDLENLPFGFVVGPYLGGQQTAHYLRADFHWQSAQAEPTEQLTARLRPYLPAREAIHVPDEQSVTYFTSATEPASTPQAQFKATVAEAIAAIEAGQLQKVVLSRALAVPLPADFTLPALFERLVATYPSAFVSLVSVPGLGTWAGATPETLVSLDEQRVFRTVALAGTQNRGDLANLNQAAWTQKEIEEQALVSRYIINCFKKIRLREFEEDGPRTVAAGHLIHLRTDFTVDMQATNFPELGSVMLKLLHPTSAVCGMPQPAAQAFITAHEGYARQLYSGYLGPVNAQGATHLFVNLRCMQLLQGHALLYAGAGITRDSQPDREWQETESKTQVMRRVL
ncbi:MAG: chorismate-binding protein [Bernardetiaceae bacterium]|nr:chorismate-binding protein [Bernardetiaceae bacterium]